MAKYLHVSDLLERRILHGDYLLKEFPTDRQLSSEFEVDARTARKAVAKLIEAGLLKRQSNGRPVVTNTKAIQRATTKPSKAGRSMPTLATPRVALRATLRVALLSIAYPSPSLLRWQRAIMKIAAEREALFRPVTFVHLDDAIVPDTLDGFDGVFFGLFGQDPTPHLLRTIQRHDTPVVFLDADASDAGYPSIWMTAPSQVDVLLNHLADAGHKKVACLNTQLRTEVTCQRIDTWKRWAGTERAGRLVDQPTAPFESAAEQAYRVALQTFKDGGFDATALLCCTAPAAKGVYRAAHEVGVEIGKDLAICAADDDGGEATLMVPSLTSIHDLDPSRYLQRCFDWLAGGGKVWKGSRLMQPDQPDVFLGESTRYRPVT